jgi:hypothetical protein
VYVSLVRVRYDSATIVSSTEINLVQILDVEGSDAGCMRSQVFELLVVSPDAVRQIDRRGGLWASIAARAFRAPSYITAWAADGSDVAMDAVILGAILATEAAASRASRLTVREALAYI